MEEGAKLLYLVMTDQDLTHVYQHLAHQLLEDVVYPQVIQQAQVD